MKANYKANNKGAGRIVYQPSLAITKMGSQPPPIASDKCVIFFFQKNMKFS